MIPEEGADAPIPPVRIDTVAPGFPGGGSVTFFLVIETRTAKNIQD
jgi:hypothetical protein